MTKDFEIRKFEDRPKYCRVPIYIGGDQQVHIMQPYNPLKDEPGPAPKSLTEWVALLGSRGQVVVSFEALDDFIAALKKFRDDREALKFGERMDDLERISGEGGTLDAITWLMKRERARRGLPPV